MKTRMMFSLLALIVGTTLTPLEAKANTPEPTPTPTPKSFSLISTSYGSTLGMEVKKSIAPSNRVWAKVGGKTQGVENTVSIHLGYDLN